MTIEKLNEKLGKFLSGIPGIIGIMIINKDGKPVYINGCYDLHPELFGSKIAICNTILKIIGNVHKQKVNSILTEYDQLRLYQIEFVDDHYLIVLLKIKTMYFGEVRNKIHNALEEITKE